MVRSDIILSTFAVVGLALASLLLGNGYALNVLTWIGLAALTASALRFVLLIGELNFATAAFYGIGAYSAGAATTILALPFPIALALGGLVAGAASLVFGFVTLKTKGPYFLLIGFAFTEVMRIVYTQISAFGGNSGMVGIFPPAYFGSWFPAFVLLLCGLLTVVLYAIETSHLGKLFVAIRDNEAVVESVGIRAHTIKIVCFGIASLVTGIAGALHAFVNNVISPPDFGFLLSTFALAYLKVGGEGSVVGPIAGAVLLLLLSTLATSFGASEHIFYGAAIVVAVLLLPNGVVGALKGLRRNAGGSTATRVRAEESST